MQKKRSPGARAREVLADRLALFAKEKNASDLHHDRERPAGIKNAVYQQIADKPAFMFFGPNFLGIGHDFRGALTYVRATDTAVTFF